MTADDETPAQQPDAGAQASQRPTLLRPGETMQDQQMNGTPVPKKR